jgi:hypothetical protein
MIYRRLAQLRLYFIQIYKQITNYTNTMKTFLYFLYFFYIFYIFIFLLIYLRVVRWLYEHPPG